MRSGLTQLLTTSCFLKSESSHSLPRISWSVLRVSAQVVVCCGLTWKGTFAGCNHSSSLLLHVRSLSELLHVENRMHQVRARLWRMHGSSVFVRKGRRDRTNWACPLFSTDQETDASSTILASCCNLPVQLNDGAWELRSHCLLITSSLFVLCLAAALDLTRAPSCDACSETQPQVTSLPIGYRNKAKRIRLIYYSRRCTVH